MPTDAQGHRDADELFAEWAQLAEEGRAPSFDDFVARAPSDVADELRAHHARWQRLQPLIERHAFADSGRAANAAPAFEVALAAEDVRAQIESGRSAADRYEILDEVGRGGMGIVFKARDRHLGRTLCIKVVRRQWVARDRAGSSLDRGSLERFVKEARAAARLSHPGIVPVHELGCDALGRVYFTMDLIDGRDLGRILAELREGRGEWNVARVVGVLQRAGEAIAYAHEQGVLHRDVKPSNVMVGAFGQVYVTDWGLARTAESAALDAAPGPASSSSASATRDGFALGTIAYMSPEQARGELERIDARSDVWSLGAVLYELLAGQRPFAERDASHLLEAVRTSAPRSLDELAPHAPPELVAVCRKAMAREPRDRYGSARELADDLRAWLEGRAVGAHRTDAIERASKWIRRNRALSAAFASIVVLTLGALAVIAVLGARGNRARDDVFRLATQQDLRELRRRGDELWPVTARRIEAYESWLADADRALATLPLHRATLQEIEARGRLVELEAWIASHPEDSRVRALLGARAKAAELEAALPDDAQRFMERSEGDRLKRVRAEAKELETPLEALDRFEFDDSRDAWWHAQLAELVRSLEAFAAPKHGCIDGVSPEFGLGVRRRLELARDLSELEHATDWNAVARDVAADPRYGGLQLGPQEGLVPLGRDPRSHLFEFAHRASGRAPERDANGELRLEDDAGVVLVLLPPGSVELGGQTDAAQAHHDAEALKIETPRQAVDLAAFFVSKYELTQAQWIRATGANPSYYGGSFQFASIEHPGLLPVENVTWDELALELERMGLALPTEAQWEYACRAGAPTIWYTGDDAASLLGFENIAGREATEFFTKNLAAEPDFEDAWPASAPVGSLQPNAFGLHDVAGNVSEWCRDKVDFYGTPVARGDGGRLDAGGRSFISRGGSFYAAAKFARSSSRQYGLPSERAVHRGCRPSRAIER